jgi:uncharacterized protein (DUF1330 family)
MTPTEFLFIQAEEREPEKPDAVARVIRSGGGVALAARADVEVEQLEPGTPPAMIVLGRWPSRAEFDAAWTSTVADRIDTLLGRRAIVLAMSGLPPEGLPEDLEIPTVASVPPIHDSAPPAYMTIQGSVSDQARIAGYRDVILPMMKQLGAYYIVFLIEEGAVRVLRGTWNEQIFAISAWPTQASAHDFWYSDRYQTVAVPIRAPISAFNVHLLQGSPPARTS